MASTPPFAAAKAAFSAHTGHEVRQGCFFLSPTLNVLAMGVLVGDLKAMESAAEFAERADDKAVWSRLAKAQLAEGLLAPSIASYLKADDHKDWPEVVSAAEGSDSYEELVPYLVMARTHVKEAQLDTT